MSLTALPQPPPSLAIPELRLPLFLSLHGNAVLFHSPPFVVPTLTSCLQLWSGVLFWQYLELGLQLPLQGLNREGDGVEERSQ